MTVIYDQTIISKHNPTGTRPCTQSDIDHLQRISSAYIHLRSTINAVMGQADDIVHGTPTPTMTDRERTIFMKVEQYRTELEQEDVAPIEAYGFKVFDHTGNLVTP